MNIRVEAPYDSYIAAVTLQKGIFEKAVGNRFYFSRKTGYFDTLQLSLSNDLA